MTGTQISAFITDRTKNLVERHIGAHGMRIDHFVEDALLHHLQALRELPPDLIVPPKVVLSREAFDHVAKLAEQPRQPTPLLRDLMAGKKAERT